MLGVAEPRCSFAYLPPALEDGVSLVVAVLVYAVAQELLVVALLGLVLKVVGGDVARYLETTSVGCWLVDRYLLSAVNHRWQTI